MIGRNAAAKKQGTHPRQEEDVFRRTSVTLEAGVRENLHKKKNDPMRVSLLCRLCLCGWQQRFVNLHTFRHPGVDLRHVLVDLVGPSRWPLNVHDPRSLRDYEAPWGV